MIPVSNGWQTNPDDTEYRNENLLPPQAHQEETFLNLPLLVSSLVLLAASFDQRVRSN